MSSIVQQIGGLARRKFLQRSAAVAVIRFTSLICIFVMQVLLARLVGDSDEYGKYAWGQSLLFMVGSIASLGVPVVAGRFVASLSARGLEQNTSAVISRSHQLLLCAAAVSAVIAAAIYLLYDTTPEDRGFAGIASLAIFMAPILSFGLLYQNLSQARHWMVMAFLPIQIVRPLVTMLLASSAWYLGGVQLNGLQLLALVGCSLLLAHVPQAILYRRRQQRLLASAGGSGDATDFSPNRLMSTALPVFVTRLAGLFVEYSNVLLVGFLAGPAAAGAYFAAERLAILAAMPGKIFAPVAQPEYAAAFARGDEVELKRLVRRTAHTVFWPTAAIVMLMVFMAAPLMGLFGEGFEEGKMVLILLALGTLVKTVFGPVIDLLLMTGRQAFLPRVQWCTAIFHGACLALVVPQFGSVGAALTLLASGILSALWLALLVRRELDINPTVFTRPFHR